MSKQNILCSVLVSLNVVTWLMGASLCDLDSVSGVHKCSGCFGITCLALQLYFSGAEMGSKMNT